MPSPGGSRLRPAFEYRSFAQPHILEATKKIHQAHERDKSDLGGHAEKAIQLFDQASMEVKSASELEHTSVDCLVRVVARAYTSRLLVRLTRAGALANPHALSYRGLHNSVSGAVFQADLDCDPICMRDKENHT